MQKLAGRSMISGKKKVYTGSIKDQGETPQKPTRITSCNREQGSSSFDNFTVKIWQSFGAIAVAIKFDGVVEKY